MPRTKRPVRTQEKSSANEELKKLDMIVAEQKKNIDSLVEIECRKLELAFKVLLNTTSTKLNKTIGQLKNEIHMNEIANSTRKTRNSRRSASHDDGYLTETSQDSGDRGKQTMGPPPSRASRARSAEASARKPAGGGRPARRRSRSVYRTPACSKLGACNYPPITPKVAPHTPLALLRQPRQGEMVVSMSGSPVMVPNVNTMSSEDKANCNILLRDGTMLTLQPRDLRQSQAFIPFSLMNADVFHQIKTLKDNLDKVVKLGESAFK